MAKAVAVRELEFKPGATAELFERFVRAGWNALTLQPGVRFRVLKGVRGARTRKYLWLSVWDSVERWQETIPRPGEPAAERRQYHAANQALGDTSGAFATVPGGGSAFTDHAEIGEEPPALRRVATPGAAPEGTYRGE
jgi:heme-degrading monooxygenase HmoA